MLFYKEFRKANITDALFEIFESYLRDQGLEARDWQINDATLITILKQYNSSEDNQEIKANLLPAGLNKSPNRFQERDLDAFCVKNNNKIHYDRKNSICIDVEYGFIRHFVVTPTNIHNS